MEYAKFGTLQQYLNKKDPASLPETEMRSMFIQYLSGLRYLHANRVLHGDIHDGNVMLFEDPEVSAGYVLKIVDFGCSVRMEGVVLSYMWTDVYRSYDVLERIARYTNFTSFNLRNRIAKMVNDFNDRYKSIDQVFTDQKWLNGDESEWNRML